MLFALQKYKKTLTNARLGTKKNDPSRKRGRLLPSLSGGILLFFYCQLVDINLTMNSRLFLYELRQFYGEHTVVDAGGNMVFLYVVRQDKCLFEL